MPGLSSSVLPQTAHLWWVRFTGRMVYLEILLALYFLWAVFLKVLCHQEENDEVGKGQENGDSLG